ncbi:MAG: type II toxin-antitoxin system HicB family antitoxin [Prochloron sp. SP5CPC1]|nr:type II toxin-antitoxin system HicB family antitoxin [Candidatus Paraprochloron terpiosi SP5CPC1]
MVNEYTAIIQENSGWWIGWIEKIPGVNCQEVSYEELLESLRITLQEALEFNRQDAISAASENYREVKIAV